MDRGIEPLCQDWESCILTVRWIHHYILPQACGSWGIRTPGTINSHGSLANCWFQPLTQTSFPVYCTEAFSLKCGCKGKHLFLFVQIFCSIFLWKSDFCLFFYCLWVYLSSIMCEVVCEKMRIMKNIGWIILLIVLWVKYKSVLWGLKILSHQQNDDVLSPRIRTDLYKTKIDCLTTTNLLLTLII